MRVIENNYKKPEKDRSKETNRIACDHCDSVFEYDESDVHIGAYGCAFVTCPCCGKENDALDSDSVELTPSNVRFPVHYGSFKEGIKIENTEVDKYVRKCIDDIREESGDWSTTACGDTAVFVFRMSGDEEYWVYVGKGGYETYIPFEACDYKD